jgi:hypothetical protein
VLYQHSDISFQVPDGWRDKSITAFAAPLEAGQTLASNAVMTRDVLPRDKTVAQYADGQLVELSKRLEGFDLRKRTEFVLNGQAPAVALDFTWRSDQGLLRQWEVFCPGPGAQVFSLVMTALDAEFARYEPQFAAIVNSIKLMGGE